MAYEIDFLGVSKETKSGDAILIRFGNLNGSRDEQTVVLIDGGFKDTGDDIVGHVQTHYGTNRVDLVISSHPDQDHVNGLKTVIDTLDVGQLWIHKPWEHNKGLADKFVDGRITDNSIGERLKDVVETAYDLVKAAENKGITIREPFSGKVSLTGNGGTISVLGPTVSYYETLIPEIDGMPTAKAAADESFFGKIVEAVKKFFARWGTDDLDDDDTTSAKNNSSVITQIIVGDRRLVFTADAGITALDAAADELARCTTQAELKFVQVPHHGSRRNVGPSVLNKLIGQPVNENDSIGITAFVSCADGHPKHPHPAVLNAFSHRGVKVVATRGQGIRHHHGAPKRAGWSAVDAEPYHYQYDSEA